MATPPSRTRPRPPGRSRVGGSAAGDAPIEASFRLSRVESGPETAVVLTGDLDMVTAEMLDREVRHLFGRGPGRIVLDLRAVGFLDSTGLRVLLSLRNDAKRNDRILTLVPGPPAVQRVFALTGTRGLFDWRG